MHFHDIQNFYAEWDITSLPWDVVTPVKSGELHPDVLDQALVDAIYAGPLGKLGPEAKHATSACVSFLYMYMIMAETRR